MLALALIILLLGMVFYYTMLRPLRPSSSRSLNQKRRLLPRTDVIRTAVQTKDPTKVINNWVNDIDFPDPVLDMDMSSYYKDTPCLCEVDPALKEKHDKKVEPIKKFVYLLNKLIIVRLRVRDATTVAKINDTIMKALNEWAKVGAMTRKVTSQGQLDRMNALINIAFVYIRIADDIDDIPSNLDEIKTIERWITNMTKDAKQFYKQRTNNIRAWSTLMEVVSSYIQNDSTWLQDAMETVNMLVDAIDPDTGSVVSELKRGSKALRYHAYYADPLVCAVYVIRELDETKTMITSHHVSRISKLVQFIMSNPTSLGDPTTQQLPLEGKLPWLYLFDRFGFKRSFSTEEQKRYNEYISVMADDYDLISDGKGSLKALFS